MKNAIDQPQTDPAARRHQRHRPGHRAAARRRPRCVTVDPGRAATRRRSSRRHPARGSAEVVVGRLRRRRPCAATSAFVAIVAERYGDLDVVVQAFGQLGADVGDDPVAAAALAAGELRRRGQFGLAVARQLRTPGPRDTSSCCRAWPACGPGRRTSSTARPRPARTRSPPGLGHCCTAPARGC